jgi:AcrR family transcriptional regulator
MERPDTRNRSAHKEPSATSANPGQEIRQLRADARRNRLQILIAARDVFVERGVEAPLEEIAQRAQVGIATLYRRFPDRQALIEAVALDLIRHSADEARRALAEEPDAFRALARYMHRALDLRIGAVMPLLVAGSPLTKSDEYLRFREEAADALGTMIERAQAAGLLRTDIAAGDIGMLIIRLNRPLPGPFPRDLGDRLAHRHLDLLIDGLRSVHDAGVETLSAPGLSIEELRSISPSSDTR